MAIYIDAEKAKTVILTCAVRAIRSKANPGKMAETILDSIDSIPAADVALVVRCGSCKHMENQNGIMFCGVWNHANGMGDDGFCNYGEKRDNNG